jgi:hypothetical protein
MSKVVRSLTVARYPLARVEDVMARASERRDLSKLRGSASTSRVLDLAAIQVRHGDTEDHAQNPVFRCADLNTSIITKHALRANERSIFNNARATATKILFPFSKTELSLGADSLFVGEPGFERLLEQKVSAEKADLQSDIEVLRLLDTLPSFDPFLMRERLRQAGVQPARCYFDVSQADASRMQRYVSEQIAMLVELAFAGSQSSRELSVKLAEKLMTDETAQSLEPLRATLRLSGEEYREGVFAWKGFLYYKWLLGEVSPKLNELARSILSARIVGASRDTIAALAASRQTIVKILGATLKRVQATLMEYDAAFASLAQGKPTAFRDFLLSAPKSFLVIGEAVGVIKHVESFWQFRFPTGLAPVMDGEEATEIFHDFEVTLSGIRAAQSEACDSTRLVVEGAKGYRSGD